MADLALCNDLNVQNQNFPEYFEFKQREVNCEFFSEELKNPSFPDVETLL